MGAGGYKRSWLSGETQFIKKGNRGMWGNGKGDVLHLTQGTGVCMRTKGPRKGEWIVK